MATAKKMAPNAVSIPKKVTVPAKAPAKTVKPVAKASAKKAPMKATVKAPVSKTAKVIERLGVNIAKLTERKDKINAEIKSLRDQRAALKLAPVAAAPVAPKAKAASKAAAPKKVVKSAAKK